MSTLQTTPTNMMPSNGTPERAEAPYTRSDAPDDKRGQNGLERVSAQHSAPSEVRPQEDADRPEGLQSLRNQVDKSAEDANEPAGPTVEGATDATSNPKPYALGPPTYLVEHGREDAPPLMLGVDDKHREAYRMRLSGVKPDQIAKRFNVHRATIFRWCQSYEKAYRESLENEPATHLIARELAKLDQLEEEAREGAAKTESERQKVAYQQQALRVCKARTQLMLDTGLIPKQPERLFAVLKDMKPDSALTIEGDESMDRPQAIEKLVNAMARSLTIA